VRESYGRNRLCRGWTRWTLSVGRLGRWSSALGLRRGVASTALGLCQPQCPAGAHVRGNDDNFRCRSLFTGGSTDAKEWWSNLHIVGTKSPQALKRFAIVILSTVHAFTQRKSNSTTTPAFGVDDALLGPKTITPEQIEAEFSALLRKYCTRTCWQLVLPRPLPSMTFPPIAPSGPPCRPRQLALFHCSQSALRQSRMKERYYPSLSSF
jgi:hypothetical protein